MKRSAAAALTAAILVWMSGCAGTVPELEVEGQGAETGEAVQPETREPKMDDAIYVPVLTGVPELWAETWEPQLAPPARFDLTIPRAAGDEGTDAAELTQGYRIQLADVLEHGQAVAARDRAEQWFDNVYVTFRSPNYKVRAGDYTSRAEAERGLLLARSHGFREAWVVPDQVYVKPPLREAQAGDSLSVPADSLGNEPSGGGDSGE